MNRQFWRSPNPLSVDDREVIQRLLSKTTRDKGCWIYTGHCTKRGGYGQIRVHGKTLYAHRVSFAFFISDIPEGMTIDHICKRTNCVNPDHLRILDYKENSGRIYHQEDAPF